MPSAVLFWLPTLIWASTWHVILYQLGRVPAVNSVAYRFVLAAAILLAIAAWRREPLRFSAREHARLAAAGTLQYGLNYWAIYLAEQAIPSGLVAVLFTLLVFGNALAGWLFFGQPVPRRFVAAACAGVLGVAFIFWPEIAAAGARPQAGWGLLMGLLAVACALAGNVLTLKLANALQPRGIGLVPVLAVSMGYGAVLLLALSAATTGFTMDWSARYLASLAYLTVFGSVVAFLLYFRLAQRVGPARASLMAIVIPVMALALSAALEGYRPPPAAWAGMALCLASVWAATHRHGR
jgi:drug/metabolite transporter (DMT)-like permease